MTGTVLKASSSPVYKRGLWASHQLNSIHARSCKGLQRRSRQAGRQASAKQALDVDSAETMQRLGEDVQEAFASGNPDTLKENGEDMMQVSSYPNSLWLLC